MKKSMMMLLASASLLTTTLFADTPTTCPAFLKIDCEMDQGNIVCSPMDVPSGWTLNDYPKSAFSTGEHDIAFNNVSSVTKDADPSSTPPTQCRYGSNFSGSLTQSEVYADMQASGNHWVPMAIPNGATCGLNNPVTSPTECPLMIRS